MTDIIPEGSVAGGLSEADLQAIKSAPSFNPAAMLSAIKAPPVNLSVFNTAPVGQGTKANTGPDFWSGAKKVIDFISTPFYMMTNAALNAQNDPNQNDPGSALNDLWKGVQEGWDAGVNGKTENAHDWIDVIKNAEVKNGQNPDDPNSGWSTINGAVGVPMDLLLDPLNLLPGAGVAKGTLKGIGEGLSAAREASGAAGRELERATAVAAREPAVEAADAAVTAGKGTDAALAPEAVTGAQAPSNGLDAATRVDQFQSDPRIASILNNQAMGPVTAFGKGFKDAFTQSVKESPVGQMLTRIFKDDSAKPLTTTAENVAQAQGIARADTGIKSEPIPTMAPVEEPKNPEKDIAEKYFGENGLDTFNSMKNAINNISWSRPPDSKLSWFTDRYNKQMDAWAAAGHNVADAPTLEKYLDSIGYKPKSPIDHPFTTGNISDATSHLRERSTPEERDMAGAAFGMDQHTPPATLTKEFFSNKEKYLNTEKDIAALRTKDDSTPIEEAKAAANKEQDLHTAAVNNTLSAEAWKNATPEARQGARAYADKVYTKALDNPEPVHTYIRGDKYSSKIETFPAETQHAIVRDAVNDTLGYQQQRLGDIGKKGYQGDKARTTGATAKEAGGIVHALLYDTRSSARMYKTILYHMKNEFPNLFGTGREISLMPKEKALYKATLFAKLLRAAESHVKALGMVPTMNMASKAEDVLKTPIRLSSSDVLDAALVKSVSKHGIDSGVIRNRLFGSGKGHQVDPMLFNAAAEALIRERAVMYDAMKANGGVLKPERMTELRDKAVNRIHNVLMGKGLGGNVSSAEKTAFLDKIKDQMEHNPEYSNEMKDLAERFVDDPHYGAMIEQRHLYNEAVHKADIELFANQQWKTKLLPQILEYGKTDWTAQKMMEWIDSKIKGGEDFLPYTDRKLYKDSLHGELDQIVTPSEAKAARAGLDSPAPVVEDAKKDAAEEISNNKIEEPNVADGHMTLSDVYLGAIATDLMRKIHPVRSFFDASFPFRGTGFYGEVVMGSHSRARLQNAFNQDIAGYIHKYQKEGTLVNSFQAIQKTFKDGTDLVPGTPEHDLNKIVNILFGKENPYMKGLADGSLPAKYFKEVLESKNVAKYFDEEWLRDATQDNIKDYWLSTNLKNGTETADFLSRMNSVLAQVYTDRAIVSSFEKAFGSAVAKEGYYKPLWTSKGKPSAVIRDRGYTRQNAQAEKAAGFFELLNKNLYYEKNALQEIPAIHRLMNESRAIKSDTRIGKFVNNVYDPMTQVMKLFQTTLRPGHWVSNFMGDRIRLYMAGVFDPRADALSYTILHALGRDEGLYTTPIDRFEKITHTAQGDFRYKIPAMNKDATINLRYSNGKVEKVSATVLGRRAEESGILMTPHARGQHEDFINEMERGPVSGVIAKTNVALDKVTSVGGAMSLNRMGALRDNINRLPLFTNLILNGSYKDMDDLIKQGSALVRKWAPTSMDFTREESMYARRAVFYYTWLRGMLPNIVETLLERPGIYNMPNKALFAFAKQNGVEPLSIGNPFPGNQMFPSYYYENVIGPQMETQGGQLWGFSPMAPTIDVLDTMLHGVNSANAKQGIIPQQVGSNFLGMLNPFFKVPLEAATGESSGVPIKDTGQYLQDQILPPQLDLISKITGTDITGQNRTDKGNKVSLPAGPIQGMPLDFWNFLSGTHTEDYNSPAALRSVIGEQKAIKSAEKTDAKRAAK